VDFHHADHTHPFIPPTSGATSGAFAVPTLAVYEAAVSLGIRPRAALTDETILLVDFA